jgi:hypothetical protein
MICSVIRTKKLLIASLLVILIIGSLTILAYTGENAAMGDAVKLGMKSTAGVMATQINPSDLSGLKPGDENTPKYQAIARKLETMRSMDDHLLNAYILKINPDQTVTFLVDDLYPDDPQGSAKIGEVSTAPDKMDILAALSGPTTTKEPYTTKYGSFMTAYAPIDDTESDSGGNTYAILAIDISAKNYTDYTSRGGFIMLTGLISMILAVGAIFCFGGSRREEEKNA